ncbi:HNH endonuclease [Streptomyces sp. CBMA123]|uniref:HNH endonuclease n=1 Tax=Streptomyces sp. CBMA123 TaxID=1896313 RepID=UPI0039833C87
MRPRRRAPAVLAHSFNLSIRRAGGQMPRAKSVCLVGGCIRTTVRDGRCTEHQLRKPWANSSRRNRGTIPGWSRIRLRVLYRDRKTCYLCQSTGANEVDHIVPVARGGTHDLTNLAAVCSACHRQKTQRESRGG